MKLLEYGYVVKKPIHAVFDSIINLEALHQKLNYFEKARVTSNGLRVDQPGKCYWVHNKHGDITSECKIEVMKIEAPKMILLEYTYKIIEQNGQVEDGSAFMPWTSINSITGFEEDGQNTRVTTLMYANGVEGFWKSLAARLLGFVSYFKQMRANRKVIKYLNERL